MANQSENLKVIFFESASEGKPGKVVADGYFSFVPTFKEGDTINMTLARREASNTTVHNPIGHKTHRVDKMDWVMMVDERSKNALATLVVSISKIDLVDKVADTPALTATHG